MPLGSRLFFEGCRISMHNEFHHETHFGTDKIQLPAPKLGEAQNSALSSPSSEKIFCCTKALIKSHRCYPHSTANEISFNPQQQQQQQSANQPWQKRHQSKKNLPSQSEYLVARKPYMMCHWQVETRHTSLWIRWRCSRSGLSIHASKRISYSIHSNPQFCCVSLLPGKIKRRWTNSMHKFLITRVAATRMKSAR